MSAYSARPCPLIAENAELRKAELDAADQHFEELREGRPESLEATSLHLDLLSDLKRIHSHICPVAYPMLKSAGELPAREGGKNDKAADPALLGLSESIKYMTLHESR